MQKSTSASLFQTSADIDKEVNIRENLAPIANTHAGFLQGRKVDYASQGETFDFLKEGNVRDANKVLKDTPGYDARTLFIPKSAENKFTPFEKQFWDIKQKRRLHANAPFVLPLT